MIFKTINQVKLDLINVVLDCKSKADLLKMAEFTSCFISKNCEED